MLSLAVLLLATVGLAGDLANTDGAAAGSQSRFFVSATEAASLVKSGATVLDARSRGFFWGHLPAAQAVDWMKFRDGWGRTGRLAPDTADLARRLAELGVDERRPVLVYGDSGAGFGEEGRIAWMLAYLGHSRVFVLDGGIAGWRRAGQPIERGLAGRVAPGARFVPHPQPGLRADKQAVQAASIASAGHGAQLLDVRSREEFAGATPYFEARGGHIPGARHLDWHQLLDAQGRLRPAAELRPLLAALGAGPGDSELIVYCTGGVRSAFVWASLRSLGFARVRNYDGSFWEWASDASLPVAGPAPAPPDHAPAAPH